ncbi:MAG TPA: helix-turn-helix domain-containing protein [Candidatus Dormibacteraeota bacterium]|nr:helix-turn-helix domain-containing protein [Candidatus Dormibacteraeota bacterium]
MLDPAAAIAERLTRLGFSQYEARTYVGLLMADGATGYGVANDTGVPQPKVYETLRRLVERGAAVKTGEHPARYAAVAPATLLKSLEEDFAARLASARHDFESLPARSRPEEMVPVSRLDGFDAAVVRAATAVDGARTRVYLSGRRDELVGLAGAVERASERGVEFVIVHFGRLPFHAPRGQVLRHASTEGTLYASRKARHLAVVVDSRWSLWALAKDGRTWDVLSSEAPLLASLVKAYIRHDLFVQRIYSDSPAQLEALYGPGLLQLANLSGEEAGGEVAEEAN